MSKRFKQHLKEADKTMHTVARYKAWMASMDEADRQTRQDVRACDPANVPVLLQAQYDKAKSHDAHLQAALEVLGRDVHLKKGCVES